jgi:hypothetical protein
MAEFSHPQELRIELAYCEPAKQARRLRMARYARSITVWIDLSVDFKDTAQHSSLAARQR